MFTVFDIDGVLADVRHLLPLISKQLPFEKRDYDEYYRRIGEAVPIPTGKVLAMPYKGFKCTMVTGRSERCRDATMQWLKDHFRPAMVHDPYLHMRADDDERPAHVVKRDIALQLQAVNRIPFDTWLIFDDDRQCRKMYRELGCTVAQLYSSAAKSE